MSVDEKPEAEAREETEVEGNFTRRTFLKLLLGMSFILTVVPFAPMVRFFFAKEQAQGSSSKKIANVKELTEGSSLIFFFPGEEDVDRSILTHLPRELVEQAVAEGKDSLIADGFVAFNTICTHLKCPVEFPEEGVFVCPCHGAGFSEIDGSVLYGPAPRSLPAIRLEVDQGSGDIYAVELIGTIGYGRE